MRLQGKQMSDIFEPTSEPARSIYCAFQNEASKRDGRRVEEWQNAEVDAVHREAVLQAQRTGLRSPTRAEVEQAERYACGSADYGATWAHALVRSMHKSS